MQFLESDRMFVPNGIMGNLNNSICIILFLSMRLEYMKIIFAPLSGFPVWLHQVPGIEMRTDNEIFKVLMCT